MRRWRLTRRPVYVREVFSAHVAAPHRDQHLDTPLQANLAHALAWGVPLAAVMGRDDEPRGTEPTLLQSHRPWVQ